MSIQNDTKKLLKMTETLAYGTHIRVLSKSYPINTNMTGFRRFPKISAFLCFDKNSLSIKWKG